MRRRLLSTRGARRRRIADVDAHARVGGVGEVHVVALVVGDHFEGELVVIAEEEAPTDRDRGCGSLRHDVGDGEAFFLARAM